MENPVTPHSAPRASSSPVGELHSRSGNTLALLRVVMWSAAIVPAVLFAGAATYLHRQVVEGAQARVGGAARIGEEHALKVFETNFALLSRVLDLLDDEDDAALVAREAELHARLKRMGDGLPQLQGIFVVGSDGHMIATNRAFPAPHALDLSDRASFGHHLQGGTAPFISEVLTSRTTGEPFFDVSVRRPRASGNFGGVASTSMAPKYFSAFYRDLAASDSQLNLALLRSDGQLLAGWPKSADSADASGGDSPEIRPASMEGRDAAAQGGVESSRFRASRPIGAYPMTVVAWIEEPAVLAPWYRQIALLFALALATGIALFSMSRVALQRTRRSLQAADELRRETINRERVEEALRQAQKLEAMGRLTGGVAHDFNNLLAVVSTNLYLLKHLEPKSAETPQMAAIERAVKAGTKLTRQLLSFSRRQPLVTEQLLLQERLPDMVELLGQALGSGIAVETELDANAGPVELDAAELELALLNLALNARDAMPDGGHLRIALARAASDPALTTDQSAVVVSVTDTGHGIPEHLRERVFEPFFTTKPAGVGTGLGLSQVYGFVRRAGGSVSLDGAPGKGTTVRMCFPVSTRPKPASAAGQAVASPSDLTGLRVLVVDDNDDVAAATLALLVSMGCSVRRLPSGHDALALLTAQASDFDVLLSDVVMPGAIDGIELASRCRMVSPRLMVILMSGYSDSLERAAALGFEVLPKPCAPQTLARVLKRAQDSAPASARE